MHGSKPCLIRHTRPSKICDWWHPWFKPVSQSTNENDEVEKEKCISVKRKKIMEPEAGRSAAARFVPYLRPPALMLIFFFRGYIARSLHLETGPRSNSEVKWFGFPSENIFTLLRCLSKPSSSGEVKFEDRPPAAVVALSPDLHPESKLSDQEKVAGSSGSDSRKRKHTQQFRKCPHPHKEASQYFASPTSLLGILPNPNLESLFSTSQFLIFNSSATHIPEKSRS